MLCLHYISANSHTCGFDAITFVGSMKNLEVTLTVCYNLGLAWFSFLKNVGCTTFTRGVYKMGVAQILACTSFDKFYAENPSSISALVFILNQM